MNVDERLPAPSGLRLPATVSHAALLDEGDDARFRQMIYDLYTVSVRIQQVRNYLAATAGISGPQYLILRTVAELQGDGGATVGVVAARLHVTGPFVTTETGHLERAGLLDKRPNPQDRRSVLVVLTRAGREVLERIAPEAQAVNDCFFAPLNRRDFDALTRIAAKLADVCGRCDPTRRRASGCLLPGR